MNNLAWRFGAILLVIGLIGYFGDSPSSSKEAGPEGGRSLTALIPAVFGVVLILCGTLALDRRWNKHAMHVAAGVALVGALAAGGRAASKIGPLLSGDPAVNQRATIFVTLMALICLIYVISSIRSLVMARRIV